LILPSSSLETSRQVVKNPAFAYTSIMTKPNLDELISLTQNPTVADVALISKAYHFAKERHKDHKRFSGEPYFNHLFETAKNLAELHMGPVTISAGLLHDCIEDVNVTNEELEKEFGKEILFLVDGVTKLGKVRYQGGERHIESLRKFFVAMSKDLRVLIIKLADRLHNMKTLSHVRPEKQYRIAKETLEIYSSLAYRLGIRKLSRELADLSFPFVLPDEYKKVRDLLKSKQKETIRHLEKISKSVKKQLAKNGLVNIKTSYRRKSTYNLYLKLTRKDWDISKIYDLSALRIMTTNLEDCYRVLGVIHSIWRPLPGRIKDYIAFPKPNGYKGIHTTVLTGDGTVIEIQIRTEAMHNEAEYGIASHFEFKEAVSKQKPRNPNIEWVKKFLPSFTYGQKEQAIDNNEIPKWIDDLAQDHAQIETPAEYLQGLKTDFFGNRIFAFTPKGDVIDLPIESTPVDFAFAVHSQIGERIAGAKVNGKLVSLDTLLKNGDIVEIEVKESAKPNKKWLDFAKTTVARRKIKSLLSPTPQKPIEKRIKKIRPKRQIKNRKTK